MSCAMEYLPLATLGSVPSQLLVLLSPLAGTRMSVQHCSATSEMSLCYQHGIIPGTRKKISSVQPQTPVLVINSTQC